MKTEWGIVHEDKSKDRTVIYIDKKKVRYWYRGAMYHGYTKRYSTYIMSVFLWRKFENALFLSRPKEFPKFKYV